MLEEVEGKPEQNVLQSQAVRTMQKAMYTTKKLATMDWHLSIIPISLRPSGAIPI